MATNSMDKITKPMREGIIEALGPARRLQLLKLFSLETKSRKLDSRVVVLAEYCMHVFTAKAPVRLEQSVNFIDIKNIESPEPLKAKFVLDSRKFVLVSQDGQEMDDLINCISETLVTVFPAISSTWMSRVSLIPASRMTDLADRLEDVRSRDATSPCGSFTFAYHCMCDYHGVTFSEEVAWDIDTIYLYHASSELIITDFDHLDTKALVPIVSALEHNAWFTKLNFSNFRMTPEVAVELFKVMKTNRTLRELSLSNTGIKTDFIQRLTTAMAANAKLALTSLNLTGNVIEDKGLLSLLPVIGKVSSIITSLNLSRSGITGKAVRKLGETLNQNGGFLKSLQCVDVSENSLKGDDVNHFFKHLSQPNVITTLNLAGTECALESLFAALSTGCVNNLVHLDVSRCVYSYKKLSRDVVVPMHWKDFFSRAVALQSVNFAGCRLPNEAVNFVLVGLSLNMVIKNLDLNLSMSALGAGGSQVLECLIANIRCIGSLDISDNGFDQYLTGIVAQLSKNKFIKRLAIGKNMNNIRPKVIPQVMEAIVQFIQNERLSIQSLVLDDLKLKSDLNVLLSALGSNTTLTELDISGNMAGDTGARMLSKALLVNKKLATIHWDRNNTSPQGFCDIATALERNFTLKRMPVPFTDVTAAMRLNAERTETALQKIQLLLQRNHLPHRIAVEQTYRLQHALMTTSSQQIIDGTVIQLQNMMSRLQNGGTALSDETQQIMGYAQNLIRDVTAARQLLLEFQGMAQDCESDSAVLSQRLKSVATELQSLVEKQLQTTTGSMLQRAQKQCCSVLTDKLTDELRAGVSSLNNAHDQVRDVISQHLSCNVLNCVSDVNLNVASFIYNRLVEEFMVALDYTLNSLKQSTAGVNRSKPMSSLAPQTNQDEQRREMQKTLVSRKLRPQSVITDDAVDQSQPRKPAEFDAARKESVAHMTGTTRSIFAPSFDCDSLRPDADAPRLSHPSKDRPRLRKAHFVKRPVIVCETLLADDPVDDSIIVNQLSTPATDKLTPLQENLPAFPSSSVSSKSEMSPTGSATGPAMKHGDEELLMSSVPSPDETPSYQPEQSAPSESIPSAMQSRPRLSEEVASETGRAPAPATAPRSKSMEESLELKLAPAALSESELIQPVKKPYMNKKQPNFKLAHIMTGSMETSETKDTESKFARQSVELDATEPSAASKGGEATSADKPARHDTFLPPSRANGQPSTTSNASTGAVSPTGRPTPVVKPRKPVVKQDAASTSSPADVTTTDATVSAPTHPPAQNDKSQHAKQGATESKDGVKSDSVLRSAAADQPVKSEAGVGKRSSVRDMAAMFRRT